MGKRRPSLDPNQLGFTFEAPQPARREADLAGLDRVVASGVSQALREDGRSRGEIAGAMSALLSEPVSTAMLDAYAAESRDDHNISMARALALIAVTDRHDILDYLVRRIGAVLLIGEEINAARIGHLDRQIAALQEEKKAWQKKTSPIDRSQQP